MPGSATPLAQDEAGDTARGPRAAVGHDRVRPGTGTHGALSVFIRPGCGGRYRIQCVLMFPPPLEVSVVDQLALSRRARNALGMTRAAPSPGADAGRIDALVRATAAATGVASGEVSMVIDQQVAVSVPGGSAAVAHRGDEALVENTVCANTQRADATLVIPDADDHPRVWTEHLVAEDSRPAADVTAGSPRLDAVTR